MIPAQLPTPTKPGNEHVEFSKIIVATLVMHPAFADTRSIRAVTIDELKASPLNYNAKVVQVKGQLISGHVGIFVYDEAKHNSIRVRPADEVPSVSRKQVKRDQLFEDFWRLSTHEMSVSSDHGVRVEFQALVRVLKVRGKPAKEFSILRQFPIELVPLRILKIEHP